MVAGCAKVRAQSNTGVTALTDGEYKCDGFTDMGLRFQCHDLYRKVKELEKKVNHMAMPHKAKVLPQSTSDKTTTFSGATTIGIVSVTAGCPQGQHYISGWVCVPNDGNPPRWVQPTIDSREQIARFGIVQDKYAHWECEKGYILDGFKVEWPDGMAKISPLRCKAEAR